MLTTMFKKIFQISIFLLVTTICSADQPAASSAQNFSSNWTEAYFRGTSNNWGTTTMKLVDNNTWEIVQDLSCQANPRFKIDRMGDWKESYPAQDFLSP